MKRTLTSVTITHYFEEDGIEYLREYFYNVIDGEMCDEDIEWCWREHGSYGIEDDHTDWSSWTYISNSDEIARLEKLYLELNKNENNTTKSTKERKKPR